LNSQESNAEENTVQRSVIRIALWLLTLIATPGSTCAASTARSSGPFTSTATAHGLVMTLTVPRTSYPRGALVRVKIVLHNVSTHDVGVLSPNAHQVEVLNRSGRTVFPPAMPYAPPLPGPRPAVRPLGPGQTNATTEYVVMRGIHIRATQPYTPTWSPTITQARDTLTTRPIRLRLTSEMPPQIHLSQSADGPTADVTRRPEVKGKMFLLSYADCGFPNYSYTSTWVPSGLYLTPGCSPIEEWHARVAWLNHPVAGLDYTAPVPSSTPPPPRP
jgi:hypothetical protein